MGVTPFWTRAKDMVLCLWGLARTVYSVTCPLESSYTIGI